MLLLQSAEEKKAQEEGGDLLVKPLQKLLLRKALRKLSKHQLSLKLSLKSSQQKRQRSLQGLHRRKPTVSNLHVLAGAPREVEFAATLCTPEMELYNQPSDLNQLKWITQTESEKRKAWTLIFFKPSC